MKLIGMLDSPYVRRAAISLQLLELPFTHESLSVFSTYAQFKAISPVVKAPSLVLDSGDVLVDSTLIIDAAEALAAPGKSLMPADVGERLQALRTIGLAMAACEKTVQIVYEHKLRPAEKRHAPWLDRVTEQLLAAYGGLEAGLQRRPLGVAPIDQAGIVTAVAWFFTQQVTPERVPAAHYPLLRAFSAQAEQLPSFRAAPHGAGTYGAA